MKFCQRCFARSSPGPPDSSEQANSHRSQSYAGRHKAQPLGGELCVEFPGSLPALTPGRVPHVRLLGVHGPGKTGRSPIEYPLPVE